MAAATFVQSGESIDHTPGGAVTAGSVVLLTGAGGGILVGVANQDIAAGELGSVTVEGVYEFDKLTTDVGSPGDKFYWDAGNSRATRTSAGNTLMGSLVKTVINGDTRARIRLDGTVV